MSLAHCLHPATRMFGVHRIIERHAAERGSEVALVGPQDTLTFGELNRRANAVARRLMDQGLKRGSRAVIRMNRSPELAIALLAVLKAGAAYAWSSPTEGSEGQRHSGDISWIHENDAGNLQPTVIDIREVLGTPSPSGPNLPILTRAHDIACVMPQRDDVPCVQVPHATIVALRTHPVPTPAQWSSDPGALDLWVPLMAGAPVTLTAAAEAAAA